MLMYFILGVIVGGLIMCAATGVAAYHVFIKPGTGL